MKTTAAAHFFLILVLWLPVVATASANHRPTAPRQALPAHAKQPQIEFSKLPPTIGLSKPPSSFSLPFSDESISMRPSRRTLKRRLEATLKNKDVAEAVKVRVPEGALLSTLSALATPPLRKILTNTHPREGKAVEVLSPQKAHATAFLTSMRKRLRNGKLRLDARDLHWVSLSALAQQIKRESHLPSFATDDWIQAAEGPSQSLRFRQHFGNAFDSLHDHILRLQKESKTLKATELLPPHMRRIYGKYSSFRGRNCFATSLMFANPKVISDRSVNMVRESDHHFTMINSDEFDNALWRGYHRLSPQQIQSGLRYGDVVVLIDRGRGSGYRSLRHAAVHISGSLYFHKPSKSASTPVEFTTWRKIISTWQPHAQKLDYYVYRKIPFVSGFYLENTTRNEKISWTP